MFNEPTDEELAEAMREKLAATILKCRSDFGVLAKLDREVNESEDDSSFSRILRRMTPSEVSRRMSENKDPDRRVVIALRERQGRTLTFVEKTEAAGVQHALARVTPNSVMHADEGSHWDALHAYYTTTRINHSEQYADGYACTNQAESFFSRLRKMIGGQHHFVSPQHLHQYSTEAGWREDTRRIDNKGLWVKLTGAALMAPVSRNWAGYWQRGATS